jgi:hypothetical protein
LDKGSSKEYTNFESRYKEKIRKELENYTKNNNKSDKIESKQYQEFKKQWMPKKLNYYEKACSISEKIINIKPDKKEADRMQESIDVCHLNITPAGAKSFSYLGPLAFVLLVSFLTVFIPFMFNPEANIQSGMFFVIFSLLIGLSIVVPLGKLPDFLANNWRMNASNQMVLSIFYIVTYMRHTSNLENAIDFAAEHLPPPLSIDLKKVIWNLETQKYSSIKESLDAYLETWKKWNVEYVESMHLIEASLYENSESRRLDSLEKSLKLILDETYEKMLHYAHNLQSPLTMLNMLGIVLPILGLVILPLVVSFMNEVKWYHLMALYNMALPAGVYYLGKVVLSTRPTGYGEQDISETDPSVKKYRNILFKVGTKEVGINPLFVAISLLILFLFIGMSPIILHNLSPGFDIVITTHSEIKFIDNYKIDKGGKFYLLGYSEDKNNPGEYIGPFGLGASILGLFIPLGFGLSIGTYYRLRSKNVIKIREESKKLENEFAGALFQLGNRIGDGLPVEIAFSKVSEVMTDTVSGRFFELVSINITKLGMDVEQAIFDPKEGAIHYYPSSLIESSMKVLVESSKKGPLVASQALINVSEYIKQIHRVDERLKDLMADTISSMTSQIQFLTPAIAGIVIGITSMITAILGNLTDQMSTLNKGIGESGLSGAGASGTGSVGLGADFFGQGIPTFYFQLIVGLYVVQIIFIMTIIVNGIKNGSDPLSERYMLGNNLFKSTILYTIIAFIVMLIFNLVAGIVVGGLATSVT